VSWFDGAPARSLRWSWNRLMEDLAPILHGEGKVIFVNPLDKRLDVMRHVDGFFDEIPGIHGDALLCVRKPALVFNRAPGTGAKADAFFQKYLYLGVHPMVPVAGNDHGIGKVSPEKRQPFLDYAPLFKAIRGKKWVLEPDCVTVEDEATKVNLFEVPGGFVIPVVFGAEARQAEVILNGIKEIGLNTPVSVLHPGTDGVTEIPVRDASGGVRLTVPLRRGCAIVKVEIR
jgi:hypothetical protein